MGLDADQVEDQFERRQNLLDDTHGAAKKALNPSTAIREMAEGDDYEGVAFNKAEVMDYIRGSLEDAEDQNSRTGHMTAPTAAGETISYAKSELGVEGDEEYLNKAVEDSDDIVKIQDDEGESYFMSEEVYNERKEG